MDIGQFLGCTLVLVALVVLHSVWDLQLFLNRNVRDGVLNETSSAWDNILTKSHITRRERELFKWWTTRVPSGFVDMMQVLNSGSNTVTVDERATKCQSSLMTLLFDKEGAFEQDLVVCGGFKGWA